MCRVLPLALLLAFASALAARADEGREDRLVKELEKKSERVGAAVAPSVVCIYVSRSDAYHKAPYWGVAQAPDTEGRLGKFDARAARAKVPADARHRARILRTITEHDLSAANVVPESYGSGIVIDRTGLVLTCAHVVKNATRLYVRIGETGSWADIHAADPRSDLAVLKLLAPPAGLKAAVLGEGGKVRTGQYVLCLSNAFSPGFRRVSEANLGSGLVSRLHRRMPGNLETMSREKITLHHHGTLIQTAASTTPGCSGGALVDLDGKVVGLTTALAAIHGAQAGGFAIPLDSPMHKIIQILKRGEEVEYGFLGVALDRNGISTRLSWITPGSPAMRAGLQPGDRIVSINEHPVRNTNDLFLHLGLTLAGNTAEIEVARPGGINRRVKVTLTKFYWPGPVIASRRPPARFGLRVDYTSVLAQRNPFQQRWGQGPAEGVAIREVVPGSPADRARLQPDKIVTHVNGKRVTRPAQFYQEMARTGNKVELTFLTSQGRPERIALEQK